MEQALHLLSQIYLWKSEQLSSFKDESVMEYTQLKQKQISQIQESTLTSKIDLKLQSIDQILKRATLA